MALQDILDRLKSDAKAEIAAINSARDLEIENLKKKAETETTKRSEVAMSDRERRADKVAERILSKARHQASFIETSAVQTELEAVFSEVSKMLSSLNDSDYTSYLEQSFTSLPKAKTTQFFVAKEKEDATTSFLTKKGVSSDAIKSKDGLLGGFVMNTTDREYDYSFVGLIKTLRDTKSVEISKRISN